MAEELKGLQEQSTPFSDDVALRILVAWSRLEDASEQLFNGVNLHLPLFGGGWRFLEGFLRDFYLFFGFLAFILEKYGMKPTPYCSHV